MVIKGRYIVLALSLMSFAACTEAAEETEETEGVIDTAKIQDGTEVEKVIDIDTPLKAVE